MTKIINLNKARKSRARDAARQEGHENAAKHGRTKSEKLSEAAEITAFRRKIDDHKRED